jgi:hypothetical protein
MQYASCCLTQKSTSITGEGSAPRLLGPASYRALTDSIGGLYGSGRMCEIRHARGEVLRIDDDVVEDSRRSKHERSWRSFDLDLNSSLSIQYTKGYIDPILSSGARVLA